MWGAVGSKYGYGWFLDKEGKRPIVAHSGGGRGGTACVMQRYPEERICVIILSEFGTYPIWWGPKELAAFARGQQMPVPGDIQVPIVTLRSYAGEYEFPKY